MQLNIKIIFIGVLIGFPIISAFLARSFNEFLLANIALPLYIAAYTLILLWHDVVEEEDDE